MVLVLVRAAGVAKIGAAAAAAVTVAPLAVVVSAVLPAVGAAAAIVTGTAATNATEKTTTTLKTRTLRTRTTGTRPSPHFSGTRRRILGRRAPWRVLRVHELNNALGGAENPLCPPSHPGLSVVAAYCRLAAVAGAVRRLQHHVVRVLRRPRECGTTRSSSSMPAVMHQTGVRSDAVEANRECTCGLLFCDGNL